MGIKLAVVTALGPPAVAVLLFEAILNGTALRGDEDRHAEDKKPHARPEPFGRVRFSAVTTSKGRRTCRSP